MNIYTIYKATNIINGKSYIGFDSKWPNRIIKHNQNYKNQNRKFYDAIKKYGWDNFDWSVLYQSYDRNHCLTEMEPHFITEYNSFNNGYNMTLGGEGTFGFVPWNKGKKDIYSDVTLIKMKLSKKGLFDGENNPNFGIYCNDDKKKKISQSRKNTLKVECPHCGMIGDPGIMSRWHLDNCKHRKKDV